MSGAGRRPRVSYVLPAHNAARVLETTLPTLVRELTDAEVIVVENGSSDDTADVIARFVERSSDVVTVRGTTSSKGFGAAIRAGVAVSRGESVVMTGADLPFGLTDLAAADADGALGAPTVYVGSKLHPDSEIAGRPLVRRVLTMGFGAIRRVVLRNRVADTQGSLLIAGDVARALGSLCREDGFLLTTEMIEIAHRSGVRVREIPVTYVGADHPSTVRPVRDSISMLRGLRRIASRAGEIAASGGLRRALDERAESRQP